MGSENYNTPITHYQQPVISQGQTEQNMHPMKISESFYKDQIQKLQNALQCQQHKHNQQLRAQQCALQQQFNIEITNIQKQNQKEKENLCKEYQHCIDQNGIQYQKALENEIGKVSKEYQCCVDQWQHALEHKQNQYNKMKDMRDDFQDCLDEYLQTQDKSKEKYCCQVCGKRMKHHLDLLTHMKKHEK